MGWRSNSLGSVQEALSELDLGFYNVKAYGALGDNSTDDSAAIRSAITAARTGGGGTIFFPAGVYRVNKWIWVDSDIHILGVGRGESSVVQTNTGDYGVFLISETYTAPAGDVVVASGRTSNVSVRDITLSCLTPTNRTTQPNANGIYAHLVDRAVVSNIEVHSTSMGILISGEDWTVEGCHVRDTSADGIHITDASQRISIIGNHTKNTGDDSIASNAPGSNQINDVTIVGNTVLNSASRGIVTHGTDGFVIADNTVRTTYLAGIHITGGGSFNNAARGVISGNIVTDAGGYATGGVGVSAYVGGILIFPSTTTATIEDIKVIGNIVNTDYGPFIGCASQHATTNQLTNIEVVGNTCYGPSATPPGGTRQALTSLTSEGIAFHAVNKLRCDSNRIISSHKQAILIDDDCTNDVQMNHNHAVTPNTSATGSIPCFDIDAGSVTALGNTRQGGTATKTLDVAAGATMASGVGALTAADAGTIDAVWGAEEQAVLGNLRTRVGEMETLLKGLGALKP